MTPHPAGHYRIWTDGAVSGTNGPLGLGVVIRGSDQALVSEHSINGGVGTNQLAEVMAAVAALRLVAPSSDVEIISDSMYVVGTMRDGWRRKANLEAWALLEEAASHMACITWTHVRGHNNDADNERADRLAVAAKKQPAAPMPPSHPERRAALAEARAARDCAKAPITPAMPDEPGAATGQEALVQMLSQALRSIANIEVGPHSDPNLRLAVNIARAANRKALSGA